MVHLRTPLQVLFNYSEKGLDRVFSPSWNPLRHLGAMAFFQYWIAAVTGIFVYIFFEPSVDGAYDSIEAMTHDQWYLAGIMRSLHRYSSDGMVLIMALHLIREWTFDRFKGVRWYAWFTGVAVIWFLYMSGLSGYWLVWDELAQYVAIGSMEWLDWLGIFGEPAANNFLKPGDLTDRFFTLLVFTHIFAPLFLLFIMWIHVVRVSQPKINPPMALAVGTTVALLVLALVKPAISHGPANLATVPTELNLDWFYMLFYPVFDAWGPGALWALAIGGSLVLALLPWLPPMKLSPAPVVTLDHCNGCGRCYDDCPYGAISLNVRSDGKPYEREAAVDPALCTRCGICVGSCPTATPFRSEDELIPGIDLPALSLKDMRKRTDTAIAEAAAGREGGGVVVVGCDHGCDVENLGVDGAAALKLPCVSMLPPSFIDYMVSNGAAGVMVAGCPECGCRFRFGVMWMQDRLEGRRDPYLRKRVPRERVRTHWASPIDDAELKTDIGQFLSDLNTTPREDSDER